MAEFHELAVKAVEQLTADALALTLAVPPDLVDAYAFLPGQHLTFRLQSGADEIRRTFSICSAPSSGRLQVAIKLLPGGAFSGHVRDRVRAGSVLSVMTPVGRFVPRSLRGEPTTPPPRRYVAVCAGSGITPVLSIMTALLEGEDDCEFVLIYGNRTNASVMFAEEVGDLKDRFLGRLVVYHVLSREPQEAPLLSGRIDAAKLAALLAPHDPATVAEWFLCGPSALVQLSAAFLGDAGASRRRIHTEIFFVGPDVPASPAQTHPNANGSADASAEVVARLNGRTTEFRLDPGEAVLDGVLRVRSDAPYACRGGVCGTCRVRLREGEVLMRQNYALDAVDLEAGFRLACQSEPVTPRVCVDFDV
jgi:ring-1,2-phenylacetyl-CoA epoxidase subunit PaaE